VNVTTDGSDRKIAVGSAALRTFIYHVNNCHHNYLVPDRPTGTTTSTLELAQNFGLEDLLEAKCPFCHPTSNVKTTDWHFIHLVAAEMGGGRTATPGGTLQEAVFEGRKVGISAFALQCVSLSLYSFLIYSAH